MEFAQAVRRDRYIGVCYGPPGVGKTLSARQLARWDALAPYVNTRHRRREQPPPPPELTGAYAAMWTPTVTVTPRQLDEEVRHAASGLSAALEDLARDPDEWITYEPGCPGVELLIVDEADRLKTTCLEQLRDFYDRHELGLILIGMPGLEKRLARYPQLFSRIGFAHRYQPLSGDELTFVLTHHWQQLGLTLSAADFTDAEAIAAVARITGGNFRLVHRLFSQVARVLDINGLQVITREVVQAASRALVIGTTT